MLWRIGSSSPPGGGYTVPLVVNGLVVIPIGYELYILSAATGAILYESHLGGVSVPPPSASRGEIFLGSGANVIAMDVSLAVSASQTNSSGGAPLRDTFHAYPTGGVAPYAYNWSFGDGNYSTEIHPTHRYLAPGNYTVLLSVTDLTGTTVTAQLVVTVTEPAAFVSSVREPRRNDPGSVP